MSIEETMRKVPIPVSVRFRTNDFEMAQNQKTSLWCLQYLDFHRMVFIHPSTPGPNTP